MNNTDLSTQPATKQDLLELRSEFTKFENGLSALNAKMDEMLLRIGQKFNEQDKRFDKIEEILEDHERRFDRLESKIDHKIDQLREEMRTKANYIMI